MEYYNFTKNIRKHEITLKELLSKIYDFYQTKINLDDLNTIEDDMWDYKNKAIIELENGNDIRYINLMGGRKYYECIDEFDQDFYALCLGS